MKKASLIKRIKNNYSAYQKRLPEQERSRSVILLWFQAAILFLLAATDVLVCFVDTNSRLAFYLLLVSGLLAIILVAFALNLKGKYTISAWLTVICMVAGPWGSILLDNSVLKGDFLPLIYITLSIQLCAIFLSARATLAITVLEMAGFIAVILLSPDLRAINWPSLMAFLIFTAVLGVVSSLVMRRQIMQIQKHKEQLLESEAQLQELSIRDHLTGLYNRRYMEATFEREISNAVRQERPLAVIMADIDDFKQINDKFGHAAGDLVIKQVANILRSKIRCSDVVCRFGGDEFILILSECSLTEAAKRARALREAVSKIKIDFEGKAINKVNLSCGVAALPGDGLTSEELMIAADKALYARKK